MIAKEFGGGFEALHYAQVYTPLLEINLIAKTIYQRFQRAQEKAERQAKEADDLDELSRVTGN